MNPYLLSAMYLFEHDEDGLFMLMIRSPDDLLKKHIHRFLHAKNTPFTPFDSSQTMCFCGLIDYITHAYHQTSQLTCPEHDQLE